MTVSNDSERRSPRPDPTQVVKIRRHFLILSRALFMAEWLPWSSLPAIASHVDFLRSSATFLTWPEISSAYCGEYIKLTSVETRIAIGPAPSRSPTADTSDKYFLMTLSTALWVGAVTRIRRFPDCWSLLMISSTRRTPQTGQWIQERCVDGCILTWIQIFDSSVFGRQ